LLDELDGRRAPGPIANLVRQGEPIEATPLRAPETDLDALPYVDRALYHAAVGRHGAAMRYFLTGRGCPFSCTYCLGPKMRDLFGGPPVRQRSVEHVLGEICEVRERWGLESVLLGDDIFGLDKAWASEFLARYRREVGLPLVCHLRVGTFDRAFLDELRGAGCWMLSFGIESGNDRVRRQIMHRDISREEIVAAAGMVKEAGIVLETTNIVGLPTETLDEAFETVALNRDCGTDLVSVSVFQPYPGTALAERAREQGLLPEDYAERIDRTYFEGSPLRMPGIVRLVNLHKFFALLVAHPRLEPLVRRLIRLRPNPLFTLVFVVTHGLRSIRLYGLRGRRLWVAGAHWLGFFLRGGRAG